MDCLEDFIDSLINIRLDDLFTYTIESRWIVPALATIVAFSVAYYYVLSGREAPVHYDVPLPPEIRPGWEAQSFDDLKSEDRKILEAQIQGIWHDKHIISYCPADGRILSTHIPLATPETLDHDIQAAKEAQAKWAHTSFSQRRRVLKTMLKYVLEHQDDIVTTCCLDSGKTKVDASFGEILVTAEKLKWTIDHGERALATERRPTSFLMMYKKNTVRYEPLGVVSACVSWNYPFHNLISPVISALFAGNAIVVKPSEQTAWSSKYFVDIIRGALVACGHSPDLVHCVICLPAVADVLTSHPDISQITFIGSRPVAHKVCESAAKALTPVTVELGGKDPFVILDDPITRKDLPAIVSILMRGAYQSAGQNCISVERVIALPGVYDQLLEIITPRIKALRLGSVLLDRTSPDVGALISPASFSRLQSLIQDAVSHGATLVAGGEPYHHPVHTRGHYFRPTLIANVTPSMKIAQTELFGPVLLVMRATSVTDAISIANSTPYALGASVFGHDSRAVWQCTSQIKAGMVAINDFGSYYAVQLPFGGVKGSGYGRFAGQEGLRSVSNLKAVCEDRWPRLMATRIPARVDYPISKLAATDSTSNRKLNGSGAWEMCQGVVETGYGMSWFEKAKGVWKILKNS